MTREVVELRFEAGADEATALAKLQPLVERIEPLADRVILYADDGDGVAAVINDHGMPAASVLVRRASLEDVFLILTGRTLEEG